MAGLCATLSCSTDTAAEVDALRMQCLINSERENYYINLALCLQFNIQKWLPLATRLACNS